MATGKLDEQRMSDGASFITAMEERGIDISAAFWLFSSIVDDWRLMIITKDLDEKGPKFLLRQARDWIENNNDGLSFDLYAVEFESLSNPGSIALAKIFAPIGDFVEINQVSIGPISFAGVIYPPSHIYRVRSSEILADEMSAPALSNGRTGRDG